MIRGLGIGLVVFFSGCTLKYEVDMRPSKDGLLRTTTLPSEANPAEISAMQAHWQETKVGSGSKANLVFSGDVGHDDWHDGLGGLGSWKTYESPLGTATCFIECLGGDAHVADDMVALDKGLNAAGKAFIDLLKKAMHGDPLLPATVRILEKRAMNDLEDAAYMGWAMIMADFAMTDVTMKNYPKLYQESEQRGMSVVASFLWQRGWITDAEAQFMTTCEYGPQIFDSEFLFLPMMARALQMPMKGEWKKTLRTFVENAQDRFPEDYDQVIMKAFNRAVGDRPRLQVAWASIIAFLTNHDVTITLRGDTKPAMTNGTWNQGEGQIEWSLDVPPLAVGLLMPPDCWHAAWVTPNASAQQEALGHTAVTDDQLLHFCLLWNMSTESERAAIKKEVASFKHARDGTDIKVDTTHLIESCYEAANRAD